ncbi:MAG: type II secretion system protein, partial [Planctomycetota bacterium]
MGRYAQRKGFTLVELLVVIAIIALLAAVLIPALQRARRQAKAVVCRSNLRQLATIFTMYNDHKEGHFPNQGFSDIGVPETWMYWMRAFSAGSEGVFCCPMAEKPAKPNGQDSIDESVTGGKFLAWGRVRLLSRSNVTSEYYHGSYGLNNWLSVPPKEEFIIGIVVSPLGAECFWRTSSDVKHAANNIPLFLDSWWWCSWVKDIDTPPAYEGQKTEFICGCRNSIHRFCINRHDGFVNAAFLDSSVRKVGLKELWTLKWHRNFNTANRWTTGGGVRP